MARVAWAAPAGADRGVLNRLACEHETMAIAAAGGRQAAAAVERAARAGADVFVLEASCLDASDAAGVREAAAAMARATTSSPCWVAVHATGREEGLDGLLRKLVTYGGARAVAVDSTLADPHGYLSRACARKPPAVETGAWVASEGDLPDMGGRRRERMEPLRTQPAPKGAPGGGGRGKRGRRR